VVLAGESQTGGCPTGEVGEIRHPRGRTSPTGYWGRPKENRGKPFVGDRFLTGDIGYMDADGYFYLVDRKKGHDHFRPASTSIRR